MILKIKQFIFRRRTLAFVLPVMFFGLFFLMVPNVAFAWDKLQQGIIVVVGWIAYAFVWTLGKLLTFFIKALIDIASFNNIIDAHTVKVGWQIVRDLCNMFFILILLIIAFATILRIESYNMKKWLPKLLIMAVLINFSRMICGVIIDFAQVIMMTFISGLGGDTAANNLVNLFSVHKYLSFNAETERNVAAVGTLNTIGVILAGLIAMIVTTVVVLTLLAVLVVRIILLWVYTILSPLAFLLSAFPAGQKYSSQWWSEFSKQVIVGPLLAFFLWLALTTATLSAGSFSFQQSGTGQVGTVENNFCAGVGKLFCSEDFNMYIITIALLMGGLIVTQQVGGLAGSMAGKGMAALNKGKAFGMNKIKSAGVNTAKFGTRTGLAVAGGATWGLGKGAEKLGAKRFGKGVQMAGNIGLAWGSDMRASRKKEKTEKRRKFLEKIGMGERTADATHQVMDTKWAKSMANAGGGAMVGGGIIGAAFGGPAGAIAGGVLGGLGGYVMTKIGRAVHGKGKKWSDEVNMDPNAKGYKKWGGKAFKSIGGSVENFMVDPTRPAAKKIAKETQDARTSVENISKDYSWMNDASTGAFYSSNGQTSSQKKLFDQLTSDDNAHSTQARKRINDWLKNEGEFHPSTGRQGFDGSDKHINLVRSLAKGIAAYKKGENNTASLNGIISAISDVKNQVGSEDKLNTVTAYEGSVIANRKTGKEGNLGSGKASIAGVGAFAAGKSDTIDVPFARMENLKTAAGKDFDIAAEGAHFESPHLVQAARQDMEKYFNDEIARMQQMTERDMGEGKEFATSAMRDRTVKNLEKARDKARDPNFKPESINMVNSSGYNYDAKERKVTAIHETMHEKGVNNEDLTERLTQVMADSKHYQAKDDIAAEAAKYEKEAAAKGANINAGNVDEHAAEIMKRVVGNYEKMMADIAKVSVESGGKIKRGDLSAEMQAKVKEQEGEYNKKAGYHNELARNYGKKADEAEQTGDNEKAAELRSKADSHREEASRFTRMIGDAELNVDSGALKDIVSKAQGNKAAFGSRAEQVVAQEKGKLKSEDENDEQAVKNAEENDLIEKQVIVDIPELKQLSETLGKISSVESGKGFKQGTDIKPLEAWLNNVNYNLISVAKALSKKDSKGSAHAIAGGEDERPKVALDIAISGQEIKKISKEI